MTRKKSPRSSGRYSPRAALVAVGLKVNSLKLLEPVKQKVVTLLQLQRRQRDRGSDTGNYVHAWVWLTLRDIT